MLTMRRFTVSAGAGLLALALLGATMFQARAAFPLYVGNVGSFLITGSQVDMENFVLNLDVDSNSSETGGGLPTGVADLDKVTISDMVLEKEFNVSSVIGQTATPTWKLQMTSTAPVVIQGGLLRISGLCTTEFNATDFEADAMGANTADFTDDFTLRTGSVTMADFGLEATYMATSSLRVTGLTMKVVPGGYNKPTCMAGE